MALLTFVLVSCVLLLIIHCDGELYELWSQEQLFDMLLSDAFKYSVPARTPAFVALYETQCKREYQRIGFTDQGYPNSLSLFFAAYDRTAATNAWYEWYPEFMDSFVTYGIDTETDAVADWCPTILYQPQNWSEPIAKYDAAVDGQFKDWVWTRLQKTVTFVNTLEIPVQIVLRNEDRTDSDIINEQVLLTLHSGEAQSMDMYISQYAIVVDSDGIVLNRYLIEGISSQIRITDARDDPAIADRARFLQSEDTRLQLRRSRDWSTRRRYLNNLRTPPVMPAFTETGFKYFPRMPEEICQYVTEYHRSQIGNKKKMVENFPKDGTQINVREVDTFMMHLPPQKKRWIGELLQGMMEEWSATKLQYSTIYGLREYVNGAVLKSHVDRIETHIISVILHIAHDPPQESWPIEVWAFDGKRYYIEDEPCSMTFYESSKLIHGRPFTYNGTSWVNAFLHYRPIDWNGYVFTADNVVVTPDSRTPLVDWVYG